MSEGQEDQQRQVHDHDEDAGAGQHSPEPGNLGGDAQEQGGDPSVGTPDIGEGGEAGQTQVPAPDDDAGGAEDEQDRTE